MLFCDVVILHFSIITTLTLVKLPLDEPTKESFHNCNFVCAGFHYFYFPLGLYRFRSKRDHRRAGLFCGNSGQGYKP